MNEIYEAPTVEEQIVYLEEVIADSVHEWTNPGQAPGDGSSGGASVGGPEDPYNPGEGID